MFDNEQEPKLFKGIFNALIIEVVCIASIIGLAKIAMALFLN